MLLCIQERMRLNIQMDFSNQKETSDISGILLVWMQSEHGKVLTIREMAIGMRHFSGL